MVKAGAFDIIEKNRKKILLSIPKIIQTIKNNHEDKISKQTNLFDSANGFENSKFEFISNDPWEKKEMLLEEFASLGFYMSDHPLNEYKELFSQLNVKTYKDFIKDDKNECLTAGTIMSIVEKKSSKGTPFAIVKFSDNSSEFELFLFSDILIKNREKLKESSSFILTLHKDTSIKDKNYERINVRKISDLSEMINNPYEKVSIELNNNYNLEELKKTLSEEGSTEINIIIREKDKSFAFKLEKTRKFDLAKFNDVKNKEYVKKISF